MYSWEFNALSIVMRNEKNGAMELKVTLIQTNPEWKKKEVNLRRISGLMENQPESDVVLLPEMFSTGFSMDVEELAENMSGMTVTWMMERASALQSVVAGSLIAREAGHFYNRLVWARPDGKLQWYDKHHLFTMGEEHHHYSPGKQRVTVEWKGWKIRLLVCYDLRFPVWARNHDDYDLLVYLANWPTARHQVWKSLLKARALENQCYCAGVNRVGIDGKGISHTGDSAVITPRGDTSWLGDQETSRTFTLNLEELKKFRKKFPVLNDRDRFDIEF